MKSLRTAIMAAIAGTVVAISVSAVASAAVLPPSQRLSDAKIAEFKASSQTLLSQNTSPQALTLATKLLVGSDPSTLDAILSLVTESSTTPQQIQSIVTGLAQAATLAASTGDQAFANEIQAAIARKDNPSLIAAYQAAVSASLIASTGGGGGGSTGGGAGGGVGGYTGTTGLVFGGTNSGTSLGTGGSGNSGFASSNGASVGGASSSVSPR